MPLLELNVSFSGNVRGVAARMTARKYVINSINIVVRHIGTTDRRLLIETKLCDGEIRHVEEERGRDRSQLAFD